MPAGPLRWADLGPPALHRAQSDRHAALPERRPRHFRRGPRRWVGRRRGENRAAVNLASRLTVSGTVSADGSGSRHRFRATPAIGPAHAYRVSVSPLPSSPAVAAWRTLGRRLISLPSTTGLEYRAMAEPDYARRDRSGLRRARTGPHALVVPARLASGRPAPPAQGGRANSHGGHRESMKPAKSKFSPPSVPPRQGKPPAPPSTMSPQKNLPQLHSPWRNTPGGRVFSS